MLGKYRRAAPLLFCALPLALSAGCGGAKPAEKPLSPSDSAVALEARSLDDPRLLSFIAAAERLREPAPQALPAAPPPWSLGALTLAALYFHPDLDVARSALANAQAGTVTAAERPNPSVAFVPPPFLFGGVVNVVLETFGKRDARIDQADARVVAARHDLEEAGWQVRAGVRAAMLALWTAEQRRDLLTAERAPLDRCSSRPAGEPDTHLVATQPSGEVPADVVDLGHHDTGLGEHGLGRGLSEVRSERSGKHILVTDQRRAQGRELVEPPGEA